MPNRDLALREARRAGPAVEPSKIELIEELSGLMAKVPLQLHPEIWHDLHEADLTVAQAGALSLLMGGARRVSDIARSLGISQSAATNMLDRLERRKLIRRRQALDDRRAVECHITALGRKRMALVSRSVESRVTALAEEFSQHRLRTLVSALRALSGASPEQH